MQINLDDKEFFVDPVILPIHNFDVILEMDWLSTFKVQIDFFTKTMMF